MKTLHILAATAFLLSSPANSTNFSMPTMTVTEQSLCKAGYTDSCAKPVKPVKPVKPAGGALNSALAYGNIVCGYDADPKLCPNAPQRIPTAFTQLSDLNFTCEASGANRLRLDVVIRPSARVVSWTWGDTGRKDGGQITTALLVPNIVTNEFGHAVVQGSKPKMISWTGGGARFDDEDDATGIMIWIDLHGGHGVFDCVPTSQVELPSAQAEQRADEEAANAQAVRRADEERRTRSTERVYLMPR
jgi:hypothetical protein